MEKIKLPSSYEAAQEKNTRNEKPQEFQNSTYTQKQGGSMGAEDKRVVAQGMGKATEGRIIDN